MMKKGKGKMGESQWHISEICEEFRNWDFFFFHSEIHLQSVEKRIKYSTKKKVVIDFEWEFVEWNKCFKIVKFKIQNTTTQQQTFN